MKTADIEVGQEYAIASRDWQMENPDRARVLATKVEYEGVDRSARYYGTKSMTGGVQVEYLSEKTGEPIGRDVVRPAHVQRTWADELELKAVRAERKARAAAAKADRDERLEDAVATLRDILGEESPYSIRKAYTQGIGYTGVELTLTQVETLLERVAELEEAAR